MRVMKNVLACLSLMTLVFAAACDSDTAVTAPTPTPTVNPGGGNAADVTISISSFAFAPASVTLEPGQRVAWRNDDTVPHTATANGGGFDTGTIAPGATSSPIILEATGTFAYRCTLHPEMVATLVVQE